MKVYKFGGTSVGLPERMEKVRTIITSTPGVKVIVLSAVSGTTNDLVKLCSFAGDVEMSSELLNQLIGKYHTFVTELFNETDTSARDEMLSFLQGENRSYWKTCKRLAKF